VRLRVLRIEVQRALVAFLPGLAVPEVERQIPGGLLFAGRARRRLEHRFEPLARLLLVAAREPDRPLGDERLGQVRLLLQRLLVGLVGVLLLSDRLRYPPLHEEDLGIVRVPGHRFLDPLVGFQQPVGAQVRARQVGERARVPRVQHERRLELLLRFLGLAPVQAEGPVGGVRVARVRVELHGALERRFRFLAMVLRNQQLAPQGGATRLLRGVQRLARVLTQRLVEQLRSLLGVLLQELHVR